jgi:hypothetical protein
VVGVFPSSPILPGLADVLREWPQCLPDVKAALPPPRPKLVGWRNGHPVFAKEQPVSPELERSTWDTMTVEAKVVWARKFWRHLAQKISAARNAGCKAVILPKENEREVANFSPDLYKGMRLIFVETLRNDFRGDVQQTAQPSSPA